MVSIEQANNIAEAAAKKAVRETLLALGVDVEDPRETQQDFAHLRKQRIASDQVGQWTKKILLSALISGCIAIFLIGVKNFNH